MQRVVEAGVDRLEGPVHGVVADADEADLPRLAGLHGGVVQAVRAARHGHEARVVELVDVDHIGPERLQARLQVAVEALGVLRRGLGGQRVLAAPVTDGRADLGLAVGVDPRGVDVADAAVQRPVQYPPGLLEADALDRQRAKPRAGDREAGTAKLKMVHIL